VLLGKNVIADEQKSIVAESPAHNVSFAKTRSCLVMK
jgi:hypothetical protein